MLLKVIISLLEFNNGVKIQWFKTASNNGDWTYEVSYYPTTFSKVYFVIGRSVFTPPTSGTVSYKNLAVQAGTIKSYNNSEVVLACGGTSVDWLFLAIGI